MLWGIQTIWIAESTTYVSACLDQLYVNICAESLLYHAELLSRVGSSQHKGRVRRKVVLHQLVHKPIHASLDSVCVTHDPATYEFQHVSQGRVHKPANDIEPNHVFKKIIEPAQKDPNNNIWCDECSYCTVIPDSESYRNRLLVTHRLMQMIMLAKNIIKHLRKAHPKQCQQEHPLVHELVVQLVLRPEDECICPGHRCHYRRHCLSGNQIFHH
mmetsp:Transcript_143886/g.276176  ORF Transcript_143886/g.276176 Transcript_143886/m.276176 type:complete len:214 (-) Transcript_143886:26-667(-)